MLHYLFKVGVWLKGLNGLLDTLGGLILLVVSPTALSQFTQLLTREELSEDPRDFVANTLLHLVQNLSVDAKLFGGLYLLSHGVIKLGLAVALLKNKLWAYPLAIGFIGLFMLYQVYRLSLGYSLGLVLLTIFDVVVVYLIWHEYRTVVRHRAQPRASLPNTNGN